MKNLMILASLVIGFNSFAQDVSLVVEPNHSTVGHSISISGFTKVTASWLIMKFT
jgi:hypothetical protein